MTENVFVYICFLHLLCNSCFAAPQDIDKFDEKPKNGVEPKNIILSFYQCNSTNEKVIACLIQDVNCIEKTYKRLYKYGYEVTIVFHGHSKSLNESRIPYLLSAYCSKNYSLVALLDWSKQSSSDDVIEIIYQVETIALIIASTFNTLNYKGYNLETWHLVGHSMGAQIAGCIGIYTNFRFFHITGLDPAGLIFYADSYKKCRLEPDVAELTDIFHTDSLGYGAANDAGIINIFANTGASPQPGCCSSERSANYCSHVMALIWYADAVRNETMFAATKCEDCFAFLKFGICKGNDRIYLGPHIDKEASGKYCIRIE